MAEPSFALMSCRPACSPSSLARWRTRSAKAFVTDGAAHGERNGQPGIFASRRICATRQEINSWASSQRTSELDDLFVHTLRDIYYAEKQIEKALPEMVDKATEPSLKQAFQTHLGETRTTSSASSRCSRCTASRSKASTARRSTASSRRRRRRRRGR